MKTFLTVALIILVAAVFLNDVGHYARARYELNKATDIVVDEMSRYGRRNTRAVSAARAAELARQEDIEVYQYDQDDEVVRVWSRIPVDGTLIIGPYRAWRADTPLDTPFYLLDYGTSVYQ